MTFLNGLTQFAVQVGGIFYLVVLPMLLLTGTGFLLQKRLGLDMATLTRLNFHFAIPAMVYASLVTSKLAGGDIWRLLLFALTLQALMALIALLAAVLFRVPGEFRRALVMSTMYNNAGNYGLPLQDLAFREAGLGAAAMGLQVFIMVAQNISTFTVGIVIASGAGRHTPWRRLVRDILHFPPLYVIAAAWVTIKMRAWLGDASPSVAHVLAPFWEAISYVRGSFVPIALCALGAQLATVPHERRNDPVRLSVALRLLGGPALALLLLPLFGLHGFAAQVVLIGISTPTAVNAMLLCLQFGNQPEFASRAVFYSTLLSPLTVTLVIFLARLGIL